MGKRLYTGAVIVLWLAAMSWLVAERILPPFFRGEPPLAGMVRQTEPVGWRIEMDGVVCGEAVLQAVDGGGGVTEVHSVLALDHMATPKGAPIWLKPLTDSIGSLSLHMQTRATFDSAGRLYTFKTELDTGRSDLPAILEGRVGGGVLKLVARVGEMKKRFEVVWPTNGLLADELLPESKLLGVYQGLSWQREVYHPFSSPDHPIELIEATVVEGRRITHNDAVVNTRVIEYRAAKQAGVSEKGRLRATLFVSEDGRILRQQTQLLGSRLRFERLDEEKSAGLADQLLDLDRHAALLTPDLTPPGGRPTGAAAGAASPSGPDAGTL